MRKRLIITYMSLTALLLLALAVPLALTAAMNDFHHLAFRGLTDTARFAARAAPFLREQAGGTALRESLREYEARTGAVVVIVDNAGAVVASSRPGVDLSRPDWQSRLRQALGGESSEVVDYPYNVQALPLFIAEPVDGDGVVLGAAATITPTQELRAGVTRLVAGLVAVLALGLAAAALLAGPFTRWILRPVNQLGRAAGAVAAGDYEVRAPADTGPPELRSLARAVNMMATRLVTLLRAQQSFVANASHQLRNPLTALRLRLETLEEVVDPDAAAELQKASSEAERLGLILDALLRLSQAEGRETALQQVDVHALAAARIEAWSPAADARGVKAEVDGVPAEAASSAGALSQVLDVLIDNAIQHTPYGGAVRVVTSADAHTVAIHVTDQGPGMSAEEKVRARERFWRGASSAEREGSGLGLAIATTLLENVGGTMTFADAVPHGLDVSIRLPRAPS